MNWEIFNKTYNIRKLESYRGPAVDPRSRVVHQGEGQSDYFFVEETNRIAADIVERSIAGGEECSKFEGLHWWPPICNYILLFEFYIFNFRKNFGTKFFCQ